MPEYDAAADVPAYTLLVGSRWPAYDCQDLIRIAFIRRGRTSTHDVIKLQNSCCTYG